MFNYHPFDYSVLDLPRCKCGGEPEMIIDPVQDFEVRCKSCHLATYAYMTPEAAGEEWTNGNTHGTLDLPADNLQKTFSGEIEYLLFPEDGLEKLNRQSCDCDEVLIKFKNREKYISLESYTGALDIGEYSDIDENEYCIKHVPSPNTKIVYISAEYDRTMLTGLKFRCGDRYLFFFAEEGGWMIVCISKYDLFEEEDTPISEYEDSDLVLFKETGE